MNDNPVIIVTGASRGLGAAIAFQLAKAGANPMLAARTDHGLNSTIKEIENIGGNAQSFSMDVADPEACKALITKTLNIFGRIDGVVNDAAVITPLAFIRKSEIKDWEYSLKVNLLGPYYLTKYSLPELRKQKGRIINISSGAANTPIAAASAYCVTKAALNHFTAVLAEEELNITTVAVRPGVVDTAMQSLLRQEGPNVMPEKTAAYYQNIYNLNKLEPPDVPARSIAWLALHAPHSMSGEFRSYDDPDILKPASDSFNE